MRRFAHAAEISLLHTRGLWIWLEMTRILTHRKISGSVKKNQIRILRMRIKRFGSYLINFSLNFFGVKIIEYIEK